MFHRYVSSCTNSLWAGVQHVNLLMAGVGYHMPHALMFWRLDYHITLYNSFIIHLSASESSVLCINYHYINLLVVRVSHVKSNNPLGARLPYV